MNLSPDWQSELEQDGHEAIHWSAVGPMNARDTEIMEWARNSGSVVITHDLDFSALLAASGENTPSVIQIRSYDIKPTTIGAAVRLGIRTHQTALCSGALLTIDLRRSRVRVLPLLADARMSAARSSVS